MYAFVKYHWYWVNNKKYNNFWTVFKDIKRIAPLGLYKGYKICDTTGQTQCTNIYFYFCETEHTKIEKYNSLQKLMKKHFVDIL